MINKVKTFFDKRTSSLSYIVWCPKTLDAIVVDPVLDYDPVNSQYFFESLDLLQKFIDEKKINICWILDTHVHADHMSGSSELKKKNPQAKITIGKEICQVQKTFGSIYNLGEDVKKDGSQFDILVADGDSLSAKSFDVKVLHTPGHTPTCCCFLIGELLFTGDALFMPDFGVARCDFPGGDAATLYHSIKNKIYSLPENIKTFTGHDYQPGGRELKYESTVAEQKKKNVHLNESTTQEDFVEFRTKRDAGLNAPKLLLQSLQVNIVGGKIPSPESNGISYLKIPLEFKNS